MPKKVLKEFKVEYLQILDEGGNCDESLMPKLSSEDIKKIYEMLILIRVFDQKAFNMQRQGRLGTYIVQRPGSLPGWKRFRDAG